MADIFDIEGEGTKPDCLDRFEIPARANRITLNSCPLFDSQAKWKFSLAPCSRVPKRDEILEY